MRQLSATEAARRFSQLLDEVERGGQSFTVIRRGRAVARIGPAPTATGAALFEIIERHPPDAGWAAELRDLRNATKLENRSWTG